MSESLSLDSVLMEFEAASQQQSQDLTSLAKLTAVTIADNDLDPKMDSIELEIIANCIKDPVNATYLIKDGVTSEMFGNYFYSKLWDVIYILIREKVTIDIIILSKRYQDKFGENIRERLADLLTDSLVRLNTITIEEYGNQVKEAYNIRRITQISSELSRCASEMGSAYIGDYLKQLSSIGVTSKSNFCDAMTAGSMATEALSRILDKRDQSGDAGIVGVPTGLTFIDEKSGGFHDSDLIIVQGRPAMGKSAFLGQCAIGATSQGYPTAVFSTEMKVEQFTFRCWSNIGGINAEVFRTGDISENEFGLIGAAAKQFMDLPLYINDETKLYIEDLVQQSRYLKQKFGIKLIMIDYIQRMQIRSVNHLDGRQRIRDVAIELKSLAKELDIPIVALAQTNRGVEQRPDKRPLNSDIKECGDIEAEADEIYALYRDEYYNEDTEDRGIMEIIKTKARHGSLFTEKCTFNGAFQRIRSILEMKEGSLSFYQSN